MEGMPRTAPSEADFFRAVPHDLMVVCGYLLVFLSQHCKFILGVVVFFCDSPIIIIIIVLFLV